MTWLLTRGILAHVDDAYEWVSTREAASRLGVSPSTVERLVRRGQLVAERVERPGGTRLLIRLDRPQEPRQATSGDISAIESLAPPESPQTTSDATTRLIDKLDERDATIAGLYADLGNLRERTARAEERAERLLAEKEQYAIDYGEQFKRAIRAEAELERRRLWWRWWR